MSEIIIDKNAKQITFTNNGIGFSQFGIANEILDLIEQQRKEIKAWRTIYAILQQTGYVEMYQDEITTIVNFIKENTKEAIKSE